VPAVIQNPALLFYIQLGFLLFFIWWTAAVVLAATRYVFAFSFDRLLPSIFADVSQRFHYPVKAVILNVVIGAIFLYIATYTSYLSQTLNTTTIWAMIWVLVGITAIVLPFKRKDLAAYLPGGKLISVFGVLTVIAFSLTFYYAVTTPAIGPSTPQADLILGVIFGIAFVIYAISYFRNKARGIDLSLLGKEIPPE
jgi:amino acid transporter